MLTLVYASDAVRPMTPDDLEGILVSARAFNAAADVTGLLVYAQQRFFQALEGPPAAVESAYEQAAGSSRHRLLRPTRTTTTDDRQFPGWSMGFAEAAPFAVAQGILQPLIGAKILTHQQAAGVLLARFQQLTNADAVVLEAAVSH
jgi:hypothetical protein